MQLPMWQVKENHPSCSETGGACLQAETEELHIPPISLPHTVFTQKENNLEYKMTLQTVIYTKNITGHNWNMYVNLRHPRFLPAYLEKPNFVFE